jgi:ADP-ribosyl-[dinitrogen reductase] hydrolase
MPKTQSNKFKGCILGGAIGDAWGSSYENLKEVDNSDTYYFNKPSQVDKKYNWQFTDDTILTIATCEALQTGLCTPELLCEKFLYYYKRKDIVGIGSSTLKALIELEAGGHWSQIGRKGEYAAGNSSAMRMAPFAFYPEYNREQLLNFSRITHNNDEAYVGALAIILTIKYTIEHKWSDPKEIFNLLGRELPDTRVRDRLIEISGNHLSKSIAKVSHLGNNGYVVNSIPFAIFSATKILESSFEEILEQVIQSGGDTDTNASLTGQIMGAKIGFENIQEELTLKLVKLKNYDRLERVVNFGK